MTPSLYLLHGWGYDASFWSPMLHHLSGVMAVTVDCGYYNKSPFIPSLPTAPYWVVGHSAGVMSFLAQELPGCYGGISFNGFATFCASPDFTAGVPARLITRMIRRLETSPTETIKAFRHMCQDNISDTPTSPQISRLLTGLKQLLRHDHRPYLPHWQGRLHSVIGANDPLSPAQIPVPSSVTQHILNGGHILPLSHPFECATLLKHIISSS